ncbi:MAG TPA: HutD family protein [Rhodanobacteraceae bacterium]|nr:HutD family protein [Rhodanobacteraceae bacterium]
MAILPVDPATFQRQPWANGGGVTTELAAGPDRHDWQWRISLAQVDVPGPFSALPGVQRQIAPLDVGLDLHFDDGRTVQLQRLQTFAFAGDPAPRCELPDGPGRDINLMLRHGAAGELIVRPLVGHMVLPAGTTSRWFIYLLAGHASVSDARDEYRLEAGQAVWMEPNAAGRHAIDGAGEVILVRLAL